MSEQSKSAINYAEYELEAAARGDDIPLPGAWRKCRRCGLVGAPTNNAHTGWRTLTAHICRADDDGRVA